jgi:hypothetical protein
MIQLQLYLLKLRAHRLDFFLKSFLLLVDRVAPSLRGGVVLSQLFNPMVQLGNLGPGLFLGKRKTLSGLGIKILFQ